MILDHIKLHKKKFNKISSTLKLSLSSLLKPPTSPSLSSHLSIIIPLLFIFPPFSPYPLLIMTPNLLSLSLLILFLTTTTTTTATTSNSSSNEFIRTSCASTLYPVLCYTSLSRYAHSVQQNPVHLAQFAANLTLSRLLSLSSRLSSLSPSPALHDCLDTLGDAVDQVNRSTVEIARLDVAVGDEVAWCVSNVQTWLSAALTNEDTCRDGFVKGDVGGPVVRRRVQRVMEFTSNALTLVNRLVADS